MNKYIIGIDLGTTYSCCAVWKDDKVVIIPNDIGGLTTPSWVSFTDEKLVGLAARSKASSNPLSTIYDSKRLIGKYFDDEQLQADLKRFPFKVVKGDNGKPKIVVNYKGEEKMFFPEEISAFVLGYMKNAAEVYLGCKIVDAVITVPAYFNDAQRRATCDAGAIAGLNVKRLVNEPTAAAIAYGLDNCDGERRVLVFDLGGGTFDLSVLMLSGGIFEVIATLGDTHLGGEDFDDALVVWCLKEFVGQNKDVCVGDLVRNKKVLSKLKIACEGAKRILSSAQSTTIDIDSLYDGIDFSVVIGRGKFEMLCEDKFGKCMNLVREVLVNAKVGVGEIDDVVLIGGSTRIPKVRQMLAEFFGKEPKSDINPDEAVAYGAAVQGAILGNVGGEKINSLVLIDVNPLSLGIEVSGGIMVKIVERGTVMPCVKEQVFSTHSDNQPSVTIKIFEGERDFTQYNNLLGTFELTGLQPKPRGMPKIIVKFEIDANGILNVNALEESTNKSEKITITNDKNKFTKDELQKMINESNRFMEEDKINKDRLFALTDLENYVYNARNGMNNEQFKNKVSEDDQKKSTSVVNDAILWIDSNRKESIETYKLKLKELQDVLNPIFVVAYK